MSPTKVYLLAYNVIQTLGWGVILLKTVTGLIAGLTFAQLYDQVAFELQVFQTAAVLEVVHSLLGLVRSPFMTTAMQVTSRVTVVWLILYKCLTTRDSFGVPLLLLTWSITEIVRYSFYGLNLVSMVPQWLLWMRYTLFIVLYPMGVTGELLTIFAALPEVAQQKHFTVDMPNVANFAFSFYWYLIIVILSYIPGFPPLYLYMFGQRKKVLSKDAEKKLE